MRIPEWHYELDRTIKMTSFYDTIAVYRHDVTRENHYVKLLASLYTISD